MRDALRLRHRSLSTEKTYLIWLRSFKGFVDQKEPHRLDEGRLFKQFRLIHESQPATFKDLIQIKGVGPRTISALSLISELVYKTPPSFDDPARFSFAHGGKDGHPFPVQRRQYDESIEFLKTCLDKARLGDRTKLDAFRRLSISGS